MLEGVPSFKALMARDWKPDRTLLYVPVRKPSFALDIAVVARQFAWDAKSPIVWLFSTVGLCAMVQPVRERREAFRRFELVLAANNAELEDPFPSRLGVALAQEPDGLPGWDWGQVRVPPLVHWLAIAGQEFASWMKDDGSHFAITDTLAFGPGKSPWTRSILDHSVLLPAAPHMLASGFGPFNEPADSASAVDAKRWHKAAGTGEFRNGFYWLLPVSAAEHARAAAAGTWNLFADLVERVPEGREEFDVAFDLLRDATPVA